MDFTTATLYGLVQGLCEFFPISSSAHLALLPYALEIPDPGAVFDLVMHLGTVCAVLLYFHKNLLSMFKKGLPQLFKINDLDADGYFLRYFIITTGVTGVLALVFEKYSKLYARDLLFIGLNSIIFGALLYYSHFRRISKNNLLGSPGGILSSVILGIAQAIAVFPGVSRSGITLTTSRFIGLGPKQATEFSFLLSLPPVLIGAMIKLIQSSSQIQFSIELLWALALSFGLGILTIHFFLGLVVKKGPGIFCIYRIILGLVCLGVYATR